MELLALSEKELNRLHVAQRVLDGSVTVTEAAQLLSLSARQIKRLTRRLRTQGPSGLTSPRRGRPPNNAIDPLVRQRVLELASSTYQGFGPTFMSEKLAERDDLQVNRETLRQWLIEQKLHRPRRRRQKPRPLRERRPRFGELIQADGSPHRWFEDRAAPCTLLLCVDDATTFVLGGLFAAAETTDAYFELFENVFTQYGLPLACYTDRHSIFRMNQAGVRVGEETQVQRALRELDVELICANSPQAKGRVERINRTFQDRLVKEFRLAGIATIPQANAALPSFLSSYNARFAVDPANAQDAHRSSQGIALPLILCRRYDRALTANLTFQLGDRVFAIDPSPLHRLRPGVRIDVQVPRGGEPTVVHRGNLLTVRYVGKRQRAAAIVTSKDLNATVDRRANNERKASRPAESHPWRKGYDPRLLTQARNRRGTSLNC
jgi:transposase